MEKPSEAPGREFSSEMLALMFLNSLNDKIIIPEQLPARLPDCLKSPRKPGDPPSPVKVAVPRPVLGEVLDLRRTPRRESPMRRRSRSPRRSIDRQRDIYSRMGLDHRSTKSFRQRELWRLMKREDWSQKDITNEIREYIRKEKRRSSRGHSFSIRMRFVIGRFRGEKIRLEDINVIVAISSVASAAALENVSFVPGAHEFQMTII